MHALFRSVLVFAAVGASHVPLAGQLDRDTWVAAAFDNFVTNTGGGGLFLVSADRTTSITIGNPTPNMAGANAVVSDGTGRVFYATAALSSVSIPNPGEIFEVLLGVTGNTATVFLETKLTTGRVGNINGITLRGDEIWYTDGSDVGFIPRAGGAKTVRLNRGTTGIGGSFQSITTNGREIFLGTANNANDLSNVWALDGNAANPSIRGVAECSSSFSGANSAFDMNLGRDGHVFVGVIGGAVFSVDPRVPHDPANNIVNSGTLLNAIQRAPQSNTNGASLNPWTNIAGVVAGYGATPRQLDHLDVTLGTWFGNPVGIIGNGIPSNVTSATELPFELFGEGCAGANSKEPRMGWNGMPEGGQSFDLDLRDAEQGVGFLLVGVSNTNSAFGPLPYDLNRLFPAAPVGCEVLVSIDELLSLPVSAAGTASVTIPIPASPTFHGLNAFAQWAIFGFSGRISVSDGVSIRTRS